MVKRPSLPALAAAVVLASILAILAAFPDLDLVAAQSFHDLEGGSFAARFDRPLMLLRDFGYYLPIAILALAFLAWLRGLFRPQSATRVDGRQILFLVLSFAIGPGLVVNGILKEISHRPRPVQATQFGGPDAFRPWYAFDGACARNCSFVSGEVAGATWLLAPASLAPPAWRPLAIAGAALIAVAVALLRMAFGGHFAADVVGAALLALACILAIGGVLRPRGAAPPL
jgi:membrane-associated phospholipid phosphatase